MTRIKNQYRPLIVLAAAIGLALMPGRAAACSCAPSPPPSGAFDHSDAVFLATVTDIDLPTVYPDWTYKLLIDLDQRFDAFDFWPSDEMTVYLEVDTSWKGVATTQTSIRTERSGAACGYSFVMGQQYLIYAYRYEKRLSTGICTRTSTFAHAVEDLEFLSEESQLTLTVAKPVPRRLLQVSVLIAVVCVVVAIRLMRRA